MPFTPSHAIVALPFVRSPLPAAAIAVGAMTPDLPLFLRGTPIAYEWTHSFAWLPVTVGLALVLLLLWRAVLRPAVRQLAPPWIAARLPAEWDAAAGAGVQQTFAPGPGARSVLGGILFVVLALALGVASHIAWDAFSHEGRSGVGLVPALDAQWGPLVGYKWVQHGSSVIGVVVLAVWALLLLRRARSVPVARVLPGWMPWAWLLALPVALVVAWVAGLIVLGPLTAQFTVQHLAYRVLPPACAVWAALTILLAIAVPILRRRSRR
nr:DUF4184 family protein [Microbacterium bovistercoris]